MGSKINNPYRGLDDFHFWSRAMTSPAPGRIDPVVRAEIIDPAHKLATIGSCFAQHLSRHVKAAGLNYFVPESAPETLDNETAFKRNFGVFHMWRPTELGTLSAEFLVLD